MVGAAGRELVFGVCHQLLGVKCGEDVDQTAPFGEGGEGGVFTGQ